MKIVVLGSGVIGVTSAWYLAKAGHEVTVIDAERSLNASRTALTAAGRGAGPRPDHKHTMPP